MFRFWGGGGGGGSNIPHTGIWKFVAVNHNFPLSVTLLITEMTSTMFKTRVKLRGPAKWFSCDFTAKPDMKIYAEFLVSKMCLNLYPSQSFFPFWV